LVDLAIIPPVLGFLTTNHLSLTHHAFTDRLQLLNPSKTLQGLSFLVESIATASL